MPTNSNIPTNKNNELKISFDGKIKAAEIKILKNSDSIQDTFEGKAPEIILKDYELALNALNESVKDLRNIEIYCLIGTGGIWAWAASNYESFSTFSIWDSILIPLIWCVPIPLIIFGWISALATLRTIELKGKYYLVCNLN